MGDELLNLFQPGKQAQIEEPGTYGYSQNGSGDSFRHSNQIGNNVPNMEYIPNYRLNRLNEIQIHNKTVRSFCAKFPGLHSDMIEVFSIIDLYLELHNKHHDRAQNIVNWSGSRRNWQRRQHQAILKGLRAGYIDKEGHNIWLSAKGQEIVNTYSEAFNTSWRDYQVKAEGKRKPVIRERRNVRYKLKREQPSGQAQ
jgi:hypothetical protein